MAGSSPNRYKTPWKMEKLLVTSSFSFSHGVFGRFVLHTRKKPGLVGKGLNLEAAMLEGVVYRNIRVCSMFNPPTQ